MTLDLATKPVFGSGLVGRPVGDRSAGATSYPLPLGPGTTVPDLAMGRQDTQEFQQRSPLLGLGDLGPVSES